MKKDRLSREDYEALVFSASDPIPEGGSGSPETAGAPVLLSLEGEDGVVRSFLPVGIFTVNETPYMLVCDGDRPDGDVHMIRFTVNEDETVDFHTLSEEEFQEVMEDFDRFMSRSSQDDQEDP